MDSTTASTERQRLVIAFASVTTLFFAWGFITSMNDPLVAAVKAIFSLNYAESLLTQFAFFIAYGVMSIPAGQMVSRLGYGRAIVLALATMIIGCLCMPLATALDQYAIVLVALFIIASGMTVLQVAANPLSAALGTPERSHFRLTLSQAFNSLGTVFGPWLGSQIMLSGGMFSASSAANQAAVRAESLHSIDLAYFLMVGMLVALMVFVWVMRHRLSAAARPSGLQPSVMAALKSPWALAGALAIFFYVGSEVSIGSVLTNFLHQDSVLGLPLDRAGKFVGFYWGGAMVGRFVGSLILRKVPAPRLLAVAAIAAAALCLTVSQIHGPAAGYAAIAIGFFNSIMFPVIFTITLERSTASDEATSGLLCMAIVGGALLPPIAGHIADVASLPVAFYVPLVGYAIIATIAIRAARARLTHAA
jgi:FHS family L-fucose permease-like MFS transporter